LYIETIPAGHSFVAIVEFSDVPSEAPLQVANKKSAEAQHASGIEPVLSDRRFYVAARVVSLLFGGMILARCSPCLVFFAGENIVARRTVHQ